MSKTSFVLSKITSGKPPVNIDERSGVRRFIDPSLRRRFFRANFFRFLLFCLIPVLILGSLSIYITRQYIAQGIDSDNEQRLSQYGDYLQIIVAEMDSLSLSFDQDPKIMLMLRRVLTKKVFDYDEQEAIYYLRNVIDVPANSKSYIHSIYVYSDNPGGRFLSSREGISSSDPFFDEGWIGSLAAMPADGELRTELRRVQEYDDIANTVRDIVSVVKPIASGKGLIAINLDPSSFEDSFEALHRYADETVLITDGAGRPILQSGPTTAISEGAAANLSAAAGGARPVSYTEKGRHVTIQPISRLGWRLVTVVPNTSLYGPVRALTALTVLLSLFTVLISALFAYGMTRKHYRQVYGIIRTLNSADQPESLPHHGGGRIRDLYELIVHNIIEAFLQQRYLKVQLSRRKYREEVLELRALQSQMNPHFLSNTLHSMYWKSVELTRSPNAVSGMIEYLSDMLDYAVRTSDELVTLEEELLYCRNYVNLQKLRHPSTLEVDWESTESREACKVLKLSLQPIIENSIQYGLEQGETGALRIKLRFRMEGAALKVTVLDNGPGIPAERLAEIEALLATDEEQPYEHVGLANTFRRLGLKYGVHSRLRIVSKPGRGTAVTLYFPQELR